MGVSQSAAPRKRWNTSLVLIGLGLALVLLLLIVLWWWRGLRWTQTEASLLPFASPYQNIVPGVRYVGDEACAQCHPGQGASYRQHPRSRSLAPLAGSEALERYDQAAHNPF